MFTTADGDDGRFDDEDGSFNGLNLFFNTKIGDLVPVPVEVGVR